MQPSRHKLDGLTGLRAVAAVWVVAFHYSQSTFAPLGTAHASKLIEYGYLGVDLFFILSGFAIWHVHGAEFASFRIRSFVRFMALRLARLYPVHLFTLGLLVLLLWYAPQLGDPPLNPANYTGRVFLLNLALVQSWGFTDHLAWNYPSWSVSAEWFCYLLFPVLALGATRLGRGGTLAATVALLAAIASIYMTAFQQSLNQATGALTLLRAAPEFFLGCLLRQTAGWVQLGRRPATLIVVALALLWLVSYWTILPVGLVAIPLFAALILAGSTEGNAIARALTWRPLVAVGGGELLALPDAGASPEGRAPSRRVSRANAPVAGCSGHLGLPLHPRHRVRPGPPPCGEPLAATAAPGDRSLAAARRLPSPTATGASHPGRDGPGTHFQRIAPWCMSAISAG